MFVVLAWALSKAVASQAVEFFRVGCVFGVVFDCVGGETDVGSFGDVEAGGKCERGCEEAFHS